MSIDKLLETCSKMSAVLCSNTLKEYNCDIEELEDYTHKLFHVTSSNLLPKISKEGLKPMIGKNSKIAQEEKERVYLTNYYSLPYWIILLNADTILTVDDDEIVEECEEFNYTDYSEYFYHNTINPNKISVVNAKIDLNKCMRALCKSMLSEISTATLIFAKYYNNSSTDAKIYNTFLYNLSILDYTVLSKEEIREELKELGESGEYTFCDTYLDTGRRLYEQLIHYGDDEYTEFRVTLYNYIVKTFDGCLDVNTGGWTG